MRKLKKGFTIVELVIVIGVIAILSAILIPTFVNLNGKAQKAKLQSDLASAFSMYASDAADGYVGEEETTGYEISLFSAESVKLVKATAKPAAGTAAAYSYSTDGGWATSTSNVTVGSTPSTEYFVVGGEHAVSYLGYWVLHLNPAA